MALSSGLLHDDDDDNDDDDDDDDDDDGDGDMSRNRKVGRVWQMQTCVVCCIYSSCYFG